MAQMSKRKWKKRATKTRFFEIYAEFIPSTATEKPERRFCSAIAKRNTLGPLYNRSAECSARRRPPEPQFFRAAGRLSVSVRLLPCGQSLPLLPAFERLHRITADDLPQAAKSWSYSCLHLPLRARSLPFYFTAASICCLVPMAGIAP